MAKETSVNNFVSAAIRVMQSNSDQFSDLVEASGLSNANGELIDIDLSKLDLRGQTFDGFNLSHANFDESNVEKASFLGAQVDPIELLMADNVDDAILDEKTRLEIQVVDESPLLFLSVQWLELSVRSANVFKNSQIETIGQLVQLTEPQLLRLPNFGRKSLNEMRELIAQLGLEFGSVLNNAQLKLFPLPEIPGSIGDRLIDRYGETFLSDRYKFINLKELRQSAGLSQRDLAKNIDKSPSTVSKYERNATTLGILGYQIVALLGGLPDSAEDDADLIPNPIRKD